MKDTETSTVSPEETIRTMSFAQVNHYLALLRERESELLETENLSLIRPSFGQLVELEARVKETHVRLTQQGLF